MIERMSRRGNRNRPCTEGFPREAMVPDRAVGLLLAGMGGPDGPDSVVPFLRNLFADPAVLPLPAPLGRVVGGLIVRRRADRVIRRYAALGFEGGSPQLEWAGRQCRRLQDLLAEGGLTVFAAPAMRYWHPFPLETVAALRDRGAEQFLAMPAYPQFSAATTGSVLKAIVQAVGAEAPRIPLHCVTDWHLAPGYLAALADRAEPTLRRWAAAAPPEECALLTVAHSLPERFVRRGDPYLRQTTATVDALHHELQCRLNDLGDWFARLPGGKRPLLAFQSKVGPVRWLGPDAVAATRRLAAAGCRHLLVLPVSFTCEHIETLGELDVDLADVARRAGVSDFVRCPALNLDERWLASLADLVGSIVTAGRREGSQAGALSRREASHA